MWGNEIRLFPVLLPKHPGVMPIRDEARRIRWPTRTAWAAALGLALFGLAPGGTLAQGIPWDFRGGVPVGSEEEGYLRVLQLAGVTPAYPWTLRGFTPGEVTRILPTAGAGHPWQNRYDFSADSLAMNGFGWVQPEVGAIYNSAFPFGENDGALWAGKGATGVLQGGFWARFGRLHLRVAPEAFLAQNGEFELAPNGREGEKVYWDPLISIASIDRPQRFGESQYNRVSLGSSALTLELPGVTLGASGAGQHWGPTLHYPLLLGNNAGGFLHMFLQTTRPVDLWFAEVHARLIAGRLDQSAYSPVQDGEIRRFASAAVLVFLPRGLDGLELGAGRFSERIWPVEGIGWGEILRSFSNPISVPGDENNEWAENQLASAFFRWVPPRGGFEFYGEILREDFARDMRHYLVEPDDLMARVFGFQKTWKRGIHRIWALRGEVVSSEINHSERGDRFRDGLLDPRPLPRYQHIGQGHTEKGQILGSPTAYGGSGWTLGIDVYDAVGRWTVDLSRALRLDWLRVDAGPEGANIADVVYGLKLERLSFRGSYEWVATVSPSLNLNRNLQEGNDVFNLNVAFSLRGLPY